MLLYPRHFMSFSYCFSYYWTQCKGHFMVAAYLLMLKDLITPNILIYTINFKIEFFCKCYLQLVEWSHLDIVIWLEYQECRLLEWKTFLTLIFPVNPNFCFWIHLFQESMDRGYGFKVLKWCYLSFVSNFLHICIDFVSNILYMSLLKYQFILFIDCLPWQWFCCHIWKT